MSGARILWGQVAAVLLVTLLGVWLGTQFVAWRLGYDVALGPAWFELGDHKIYMPPLLFLWWFQFDAYAPEIFEQGGAISVGVSLSGILVAVAFSIWRAREAKTASTFGSARWATRRDVRKAGLLAQDGLVLGRFEGRYLRHAGPEHGLAFAATRSGKGVGLVVPTSLTWPGSAVIHDIKGENWALTAGWRGRFGRVLRFDPTDANGACYNPLLEVRPGEFEVRDAQNIADMLVDPEGSLQRTNHWEKTSHSLLVGAILHVLYAEEDKSLAGVAKLLADPDRSSLQTLRAMLATKHKDGRVHPVVAAAAREVLNKSENERSGVISTAVSFLGLYKEPVVAKVTSRSDFSIIDLIEADKPISLYLVVPPSDLSRTRPLMRLVLNQILRRLTEKMSTTRKRDVLFMLDEFPALGRMEFFESALAFMAGYGLRAFLIAQSLNQIEKAYGANNAILDNCHLRIAFATNDERTAKRISDALGTTTERRSMQNFAGHRLSPWLGHVMVSRQETARALLTPGEVMQLPADKALVMVAGSPPIMARKARYFADPHLQARILKPPTTQVLPVIPNPWANIVPPEVPSEVAEEEGGLRQSLEPEAPDAAATEVEIVDEFDFEGDEPKVEAPDWAARLARQAGLDRDDGIEV